MKKCCVSRDVSLVAFLLVAIPAVASGQGATFDCPDDECHVAPYFSGEGGFIGETDLEQVTLGVTCDDTLVLYEIAPDRDGVVSHLFTSSNGQACDSDDGYLEIHGLRDGAWYWITDDDNTAVSYLLPKGALDGDKIEPADPDSRDIRLETIDSELGTYLKQDSTGRVAILPHFLPSAPEELPAALPPCGPVKQSDGTYQMRSTGCALGDGGTRMRLFELTSAGLTEVRNGVVRRPESDFDRDRPVELYFGMYTNGSGNIFETGATLTDGTTPIPPEHGWEDSLFTVCRATVLDGPHTVELDTANGDEDLVDTYPGVVILEDRGIQDGDSDGFCEIGIYQSEAHCEDGNNYATRLEISGAPWISGGADINRMVPPIDTEGSLRIAATTELQILCPATSAAAGQELVPENPFPVRAQPPSE